MSGRKKSVTRQKSGGRRKGTGNQGSTSKRATSKRIKIPEVIAKKNASAAEMIERYKRQPNDYRKSVLSRMNDTTEQFVISEVKKSLQSAAIPLRPHIIDVAAKHGEYHAKTSARDTYFVSESAWTSDEFALYGAYAMWGEMRRSNNMTQQSYDGLAKYFPDGKFYIGYDEVYVVVRADRTSPMGKTYGELSSDYSNLVGSFVRADSIGYEGPIDGNITYRFWWD